MLRVGGLCVHFSSSSHPSLFCLLPPFFSFPSCFLASLLFLFILSPSPHPPCLLLSFPLQAEDDVVLLAAIPLAVLDSTLCWWISAAAPSPLSSESLAFSPFLFHLFLPCCFVTYLARANWYMDPWIRGVLKHQRVCFESYPEAPGELKAWSAQRKSDRCVCCWVVPTCAVAGREWMLAEWDRVKVLNCPACEVNVAWQVSVFLLVKFLDRVVTSLWAWLRRWSCCASGGTWWSSCSTDTSPTRSSLLS